MSLLFQQSLENLIHRNIPTEGLESANTELLSYLASWQSTWLLYSVLLLLIGLAVIIFFAIYALKRQQSKAIQHSKEQERLHLLQSLETQYQSLIRQESVWFKKHPHFESQHSYPLFAVLTDDVPWLASEHTNVQWQQHQPHVTFTAQGDLINQFVLHDTLNWFRQIHRAANNEILTPDDLYTFWRQIFPFITDGRYRFLAHYFASGHSRATDDIEAIRQVSANVLRYCQEQKKAIALNTLQGRLDGLFYDELPKKMRVNLKPTQNHSETRKEPSLSINADTVSTEPETIQTIRIN